MDQFADIGHILAYTKENDRISINVDIRNTYFNYIDMTA